MAVNYLHSGNISRIANIHFLVVCHSISLRENPHLMSLDLEGNFIKCVGGSFLQVCIFDKDLQCFNFTHWLLLPPCVVMVMRVNASLFRCIPLARKWEGEPNVVHSVCVKLFPLILSSTWSKPGHISNARNTFIAILSSSLVQNLQSLH